jgi:hypothetical protein
MEIIGRTAGRVFQRHRIAKVSTVSVPVSEVSEPVVSTGGSTAGQPIGLLLTLTKAA